jgi:DMSO/TMAO reductase YedYZ molybdopterin-dependent catalytic subunit
VSILGGTAAIRSTVRRFANHPLPTPPDAVRAGPFRERARTEGLHDPRTAALLGRAAGTALAVCFVTGVISHLHQHPPAWLDVPSRPVWGYQLTQGLHVASGIAAIPVVLAKLWVVYPRLFAWPPARDVGHALERLLLVPLIAGTLFELASGLVNIVQWYPWAFFFPQVHWSVAWVTVGALLIHLAVKAPLVRRHVGRRRSVAQAPAGDGVSGDRRALLLAVGAAAGAVTVATIGQTVAPFSGISLLAPRRPELGPQGLPVNRTSGAAGILTAATDPAWRLRVIGARTVDLRLADLAALPQHDAVLPIACVEGWSATARWSGVRLRDVLDLAGVPAGSHVRVVSLERGWLYGSSPVGPSAARDPLTLLAMRVNGQVLALDHGFPLRLIAPDRPGVQQTKWLDRIELVTQ